MSEVEICGGTHFLLLHTRLDKPGHEVEAFAKFDEAAAKWRQASRISPIFSLNRAPILSIPKRGKIWILFFGPFFPGRLDLNALPHTYLSLGLLNVLCVSTNKKDRARAMTFGMASGCVWEEWEVADGVLISTKAKPHEEREALFPKQFAQPLPKNAAQTHAAGREYILLMKSSFACAKRFIPDYANELLDFDTILRETLSDEVINTGTKHGFLVNTNAYLSRQSEQTYAGTPPIIESDSHLWSHSLLGVGIGSLALLRMRQFASNAFSKAALIARLKALKDADPHKVPLYHVETGAEFWRQDFLGLPQVDEKLGKEASKEPVIPHITCFSGRDGFRSTDVSLSAPQELLTSCNTPTWTLLTLTHEISHIVISGVLGAALPSPSDSRALGVAVKFLKDESEKNLLEQMRSMLCFSIWQLDSESSGSDLTDMLLGRLIEKHWREVNEILTHSFDFLYFYRKNADLYVNSIWRSWEVIPNIRERIPDYLVRTLCALHTNNLERSNGINTSIAQLTAHLKKLSSRLKNANYVTEAAKDLTKQKENYRKLLADREMFVRFVRAFLYSPQVETILAKEWLLGPGDKDGYPMRSQSFGIDHIQNPLRFVESFCTDEEPNTPRSVWMLQYLAFGGKS